MYRRRKGAGYGVYDWMGVGWNEEFVVSLRWPAQKPTLRTVPLIDCLSGEESANATMPSESACR
jgi:hypothetical protein